MLHIFSLHLTSCCKTQVHDNCCCMHRLTHRRLYLLPYATKRQRVHAAYAALLSKTWCVVYGSTAGAPAGQCTYAGRVRQCRGAAAAPGTGIAADFTAAEAGACTQSQG